MSTQDLKPFNQQDVELEPSPGTQLANSLFYDYEYKRLLAKKVISGRLTNSEKQDIYYYLTGTPPPSIRGRGRKSTMGRDMAMAIDFLLLRKTIKDTKELMDTIRKYDEREVTVKISNNAIYAAVDRGVSAIIQRDSMQYATDFENGYLCEMQGDEENMRNKAHEIRELQLLVEAYLDEKEPRKKHSKP
ncbi:MAG: hypothetical protein ACD_36C00183G0002 [uncultured bacterium]|nr:MAG: hypothetical protein ACD_36C00183G0002 [uncultured bacterium]